MASYILDLIARMSDDNYRKGEKKTGGAFESEKTIAWAAYEEARLLNKPEYFDELTEIIDTTEDENMKEHAYFVLGQIAKNSNDTRGVHFLLKNLGKEKTKSILVTMLHRLAEIYKPSGSDTSILYKLTSHRNWQIRGSAFQALTNTEEKVEDYLLDKLNTTDKKDDVQPLLTSLMYVGTAKSVPSVTRHLKNRSAFIKSLSFSVLTTIMLREKYTIEEIRKKLKVSEDFIRTHYERIETLTRPG